MEVHISFWIMAFFRYMPKSGISESYASSVVSCFFFFNYCTVFHGLCTTLHYHQQWRRVPFSVYPLQDLFFIDFLIMVILTGLRWYMTVGLICISLIFSDAEYLFICFMAIFMSSLEKCLFRSSSHFLIELFVFYIEQHEVFVCFED